jgi:maltose O-acetyltransferase
MPSETQSPTTQEFVLADKLARVAYEELAPFHLRATLTRILGSLLPRYVGARVKARMLALSGVRVGRGTLLYEIPGMYGFGDIYSRLTIGAGVIMNVGCFFDLNGPVTIEPGVSLGHEVKVLTSSHDIGDTQRRAGPLTIAPVTIKGGAWVGARSLILPGITIGAGSIVAAGSIVTRDVAANTLVAGVPARVVRQLGGEQ